MNRKITTISIVLTVIGTVQFVVLYHYFSPYIYLRRSRLPDAYEGQVTAATTANSYKQIDSPQQYKNSYTCPPGPTWVKGSFCDDFLERTLHQPVPICNLKSLSSEDEITCLRSPHSAHMATCTIRNLVVDPHALYRSLVDGDRSGLRNSNSVWLMDNTTCTHPSANELVKTMEGGDYVKLFIEELIAAKKKSPSVCEHWVDEPSFFFVSHDHHIYFRVLAWYALFKSLLHNNVEAGKFNIYRISGGNDYLFPEYEKNLFPELKMISELPKGITCFRKAILVPKTYATIFFQCKMQFEVRDKCFNCKGKGLTGTSISAFRTRILQTCGINETTGLQTKTEAEKMKILVMILRKPYMRHSADKLGDFQRVLGNQDDLIAKLRTSFSGTDLQPLHMEDIPICDQIRHAHEADVLMGVHGAGLVHMWWLRDDALGLELEPDHQTGNPTFRMLTTLTGRKYRSIIISGSANKVNVDVDHVVSELKAILN